LMKSNFLTQWLINILDSSLILKPKKKRAVKMNCSP